MGLIKAGMSQPMAFSAVVGHTGHVVVVEPDPVNVVVVRKYIRDYSIENMEVVEAAVWSNIGEKIFNVTENLRNGSSLVDQFAIGTKISVETTTLDALYKKYEFDFVNLTINGAETDAIQGASMVIAKGAIFCLAMKSSSHCMFEYRMKGLRALQEAGYEIGIAEGEPRPWLKEPFWFAVATKETKELADLGFVPTDELPSNIMTNRR